EYSVARPRKRKPTTCARAAKTSRVKLRLRAHRTRARAAFARRVRAPAENPLAAGLLSAARTHRLVGCQADRARANAASAPTAHPQESAPPPVRQASAR